MVTLSFLSCYWFSALGEGELSLTFPEELAKGDYDYFGRVYLLADGNRFALTGTTEYVEAPLSELTPTTVVVDGIPVGPEYTALISVVQQQPGGWFRTVGWGQSLEPFEIITGDILSVPVSFQDGPDFYPVEPLMGKNIADIESDGNIIYAADAKNVYYYFYSEVLSAFTNPSYWSTHPIPSDQTINSLTIGVYTAWVGGPSTQLWVNTDKGILPFDGETFDPPLTVSLGSVSIMDSVMGDSTFPPYQLYFRRNEGIGGAYVSDAIRTDPSQWDWVNLDTDRTLDMTFGIFGGAAFATTGGAFRVAEDLLLDSPPTLTEHRSAISGPSPIHSIRIFDNDGAEELYVGTENGAFLNPAHDGLEEYFKEPGTGGYPIRRISFEEDYSNWRAYLSDAYIFVVDNIGGLVGKYPFVSGFPGRINSIGWAYDGGQYAYLFVAADEGLVYKRFWVGGI